MILCKEKGQEFDLMDRKQFNRIEKLKIFIEKKLTTRAAKATLAKPVRLFQVNSYLSPEKRASRTPPG